MTLTQKSGQDSPHFHSTGNVEEPSEIESPVDLGVDLGCGLPASRHNTNPFMAFESTADVRPLPFFTDQLGLDHQPFVPMLHPFLGFPEVDRRDPAKYQGYYNMAQKLFVRVDRSAAEIAVFPWDWHMAGENPALARQARRFIRENAAAGLKTLLFSVSDPETSLLEPHTILFCTSLLGGKLRGHEFALAAWGLFEENLSMENLPLRKFRRKPSIGFCGASYRSTFREPNWFRRNFRPRRCQYERVFPRKPGLRAHLIDQLRTMPGIEANIIERESFFAGAVQNGKFNFESHAVTRREYVENLLASDYALCVRGGGNFSFRLYEALQLGRIPLFINTDCVLPWPDYIPWRKLCVWVELAQSDHLQEILLSHHLAMGPVEFEDRQRQCRGAWEKYLSPPGFFTTLRAWLKDRAHGRQDVKI
jgi:hypothetical protein